MSPNVLDTVYLLVTTDWDGEDSYSTWSTRKAATKEAEDLLGVNGEIKEVACFGIYEMEVLK